MINLILLLSSVLLASEKGIYGNDDRVEVTNSRNPYISNVSKSVGALVHYSKLDLENSGKHFNFDQTQKLKNHLNVCKDERFIDQVILPNCSGVLVGPKVFLTAGHCVRSHQECLETMVVFDYKKGVNQLPVENVYSCSKIISRKSVDNFFFKKDYAMLLLNRAPVKRDPMMFHGPYRSEEKTKVFMVGHPLGLPMKVTGGGEVLSATRSFYRTNLDAYTGNSGSPVIEKESGQLVGILTSGGRDLQYDPKRGCMRSVTIENNRGNERVFNLSKISNYNDLILSK